MNKYLILFTFSIFAIKINAQNSIIKGRVIASNGEPVEFASIILQTRDSIFIHSAYTDSLGIFQMKYPANEYRLMVQHIMYQTVSKTFSGGDVGTIVLEEKDHMLSEITVNGEQPVVKVVDGRLTYDMKQVLEGKSVRSAYDAVLQLPGVSNQSGIPTLIGSNNLNILINGKPSTMTSEQLADVLKNMPSSRIEKAEVMYSAPPQYHIRGAVINLVLKKESNNSLQGQVNAAFTQRHYDNYALGTTLLYSNSKISTDFLYTLSQTPKKTGLDLLSHHAYAGNLYTIEQINRGYRKNLTHNWRAGMNYLTGKNDLNITYTSQITPKTNSHEASNGSFSNSETDKKENSPIQMHNINATYTFNKKLTIGADYTYYKDKTTQNYKGKSAENANHFTAQSDQNINRIKVSVDHSLKLNNAWKVNYGAHMQYNIDHSFQLYNNLSNGLSAQNTDSKQKEYIYNAYAGIDKRFSDKLSASVALTGELYKLNGSKKWTLFPSFEITYQHSPSDIFQLSFSSDRQYPSYWEMSNTISHLNGYTEIWGNPSLQPYRNYSGQLNYIHNNKYILTGYYTYNDHYFVQLPYQSSDKLKLIYQTTNFDYDQKIGLNLSIPAAIGILNSRLTINGFYHKVKNNHFHNTSFNKDNWVFYSNLKNTLKISNKPDLKMEFNLSYISKNIQGPMILSQLWRSECGIKWTSPNKKSTLNLKGYDLFNSWVPDATSKHANLNLKMNILPDSRYLEVSFTYKFGKETQKLKERSVDTSRFGKK